MAHEGKWKRLGDGSLLTEDADEGLGHVVPISTYWKIYLSLIFLTVLTVGVAFFHFGVFNLSIAMGIATVKASLVALYFMHLTYESKIFWGIAIYPFFIFALMVVGTLGDYAAKAKVEPLGGSTISNPALLD